MLSKPILPSRAVELGAAATPLARSSEPHQLIRDSETPKAAAHGGALGALSLGALGVVYGDIGTSPLYALRECFAPESGLALNAGNVLGVLSLITWALTLVVALKYLTFIMQADNQGEGGILALLALVSGGARGRSGGPLLKALLVAGLVGASLLYGDALITPAISVLGAVEGLEVATPLFKPWIVPIALVLLFGLFAIQRRGTAGVATVFGPTMLLWFVAIAALGLPWIARQPQVLRALDPREGLRFLLEHGKHGVLVLGAVVLCITGAEAAYADMGHFGKRAIRVAWFGLAFPCLLINYYGQAAVLLGRGQSAVGNPFFQLLSGWAIYPMVVLATAAAIVASQALISGAFSLTHQAVQLGYCPRLKVVHTSHHQAGQIYVPEVNRWLMVGCMALVLTFRNSAALSAAYGIAVTGTMSMTSLLFFEVMRPRWGLPRSLALALLFLGIDLVFLYANLHKLQSGGWLPLCIGLLLFVVFSSWKHGRERLADRLATLAIPLAPFLADVHATALTRVPGTAVFMSSRADNVPFCLLHHVKHNRALHQRIVLLSITTQNVPWIRRRERIVWQDLGDGVHQVVSHFGFMQSPHMADILRQFRRRSGLDVELGTTSFFLGRETLLVTGRSGMARWRGALFAFLSRNAHTATEFFGLPPGRVVELGMQIEI